MINAEEAIKRLKEMPIEEVESLMESILKESHIPYTYGEGGIKFNGSLFDDKKDGDQLPIKKESGVIMNKGDKVFFIEKWSEMLTTGTIMDITSGSVAETVYDIKCDGPMYGSVQMFASDCYKSEEECLAAIRTRDANEKNAVKEKIKTVNDLVRYMYSNPISVVGEYTNWNAREAVKERAKELLGIDME